MAMSVKEAVVLYRAATQVWVGQVAIDWMLTRGPDGMRMVDLPLEEALAQVQRELAGGYE